MMTNREAIDILEEVKVIDDSIYAYNPAYNAALDKAIDSLRASSNASCGDTISRQAAIDVLNKHGVMFEFHLPHEFYETKKEIRELPAAQPVQKTFSVIDNKTGKEADPYEITLNEDWAKNLMYCDMEGFAILEDGSLILVDECGRHEYCPIGRFEVRWDEG